MAPLQTSHPATQATMLAVSRWNLGATFTHSATVEPKHSTQLATQAVIEVTAELADVREVPTKYFPHPSTG